MWIPGPIIGLVITITITIFWIVGASVKTFFTWLLDGVDPAIPEEILHTADHVDRVLAFTDLRVRWPGAPAPC